MKKYLFILFIGLSLLLSGCASSNRTVVVSEPMPPPMWGPAGFDVRYYYMPDMMVYYDVHTGMFIYPRGNRWIRRAYLPNYYGHFDLHSMYVVALDNYWGPSPYQNFGVHRNQFHVGYRGNPYQTVGLRSQDNRRYFTGQRGNSAYGGRGATVGANRNPQNQGNRGETRASTPGRNQNTTAPQGSRGQNATTPQGGRGQSGTAPSAQPGRGQTATQPNAQGGRGTTTITTTTRTQTTPARVPDRIDNAADSRAVRERTQEVRQQNRTQSQPTTRSSSTGQRGGATNTTSPRRGGN
jgi:hypothetical protein